MKCSLCTEVKRDGTTLFNGKYACVVINLHSLKKGHLMILPIRHVEKYNELTHEESKEMFELIERFSSIIHKAFGDFPIVTINPINNRSESHIHLHLIPTKNYTREYVSKVDNVPERVELSSEEINEIKNQIRRFL